MAEAAVTFLLDNVTKLLTSYVNLIAGAEGQLEQLKNELLLLKAFLEKAENIEDKEKPLREIERQIRETVYDAEDIIDSCMIKDQAAEPPVPAKPKSKRIFPSLRSKTKNLTPTTYSLAKAVESLRADKIKPMMDLAKTEIGTGSSRGAQQQIPKVIQAQTIRKVNIVGFEEEEKKLLTYLLDPKEELDIISIVGMPGLGKTTLANKIFEKNQEIEHNFHTRIWVYVSQQLSLRDVFVTILRSFTSVDMTSLSDQDLSQHVHDFLTRRKFLLVMDDVWTIKDWKMIRNFLPEIENSNGSRVLITTRDSEVARFANRSRVHNLKFLEHEEPWELLQYEVFGKLNICDPALVDTGKYIAKQCHGLPLAVVMIGGILAGSTEEEYSQKTLDAWKDVSGNVGQHVRTNEDHNIKEIVALSYNKLPHDLRDCFHYLAVFPEDYEIPTWTLTRLWIAEGFVRQKEGRTLEESAEDNLKIFINKNLVMVGKTSPSGQIKSCRVHDVIRAFCIAKSTDHNLFQEIKMSKNKTLEPLPSEIKKYRRLCIHSYVSNFLSEDIEGPGVRSFLSFNKEPNYCLAESFLSVIPNAFTLLRVLETRSIRLTQFPLKVTKLIHIRYITLRCDSLDHLPDDISCLWNLQTLVVDTQSHCLKFNANIWKMLQLRHFKTKAAIILEKQEDIKGAGENLQTLSRLSPKHCTDDVFKKAKHLKKLGVRGDLAPLVDSKSFAKLPCLESLKLVHDLVDRPASENQLLGIPQPHHFPPSLQRLTLSATYLNWTHMSILGKIDSLRILKLKAFAFAGSETPWEAAPRDFRHLQFLLIQDTDLVSWTAPTDSFTSLSCLIIKNCANLIAIPSHLENSLQRLEIDNVPQSAIDSARKIESKKGGLKLILGVGCR